MTPEEINNKCKSAFQHGKNEGAKLERERLLKKAQEYRDKGFELETFIYSGFLPPSPTE